MSLGNERILERFCHLNPAVRKEQLRALLGSRSRFFRWSGADLFSVTNSRGKRQMIVVETNSCPSGQKSMPIPNADAELDGYHVLLRTTFKQMLEEEAAAGRLLTSGARGCDVRQERRGGERLRRGHGGRVPRARVPRGVLSARRRPRPCAGATPSCTCATRPASGCPSAPHSATSRRSRGSGSPRARALSSSIQSSAAWLEAATR